MRNYSAQSEYSDIKIRYDTLNQNNKNAIRLRILRERKNASAMRITKKQVIVNFNDYAMITRNVEVNGFAKTMKYNSVNHIDNDKISSNVDRSKRAESSQSKSKVVLKPI